METSMMNAELQLQLEEEAVSLGIKRYRKALARGESEMPPGLKLLKSAIGAMEVRLQGWIAEAKAGKPTHGAGTIAFLADTGLDPMVICYVTCKSVINAMVTGMQPQTVALAITKALEDTVNYDNLAETDPKAYRQLQRKIAKSTHPGYRHIVLRVQQRYAGIKAIKWGTAERLRMGTLLIELAQQSTGMFDLVRTTVGHNDTPVAIKARPETIEWLNKSHSRCEALDPVFMPMVVPPRRWTSPFNGGYLTKPMRLTLVKSGSNDYISDLSKVDMPLVYTSVNAMQETAWAVNKDVLSAITSIWDGGGVVGKLPSREMEPLPPRTFSDEDAAAQTDQFREWKKQSALVYEKNSRSVSKRIATQQKLMLAERFQQFDRFYFVHTLDFRGRVYAVGAGLTPQGDDTAKALLRFADAKPLGRSGGYWLAVHGANCFGVDKAAFDDRVEWVHANQDAILESAANPLDGSRWWEQADQPFQFLAFCFEWSRLVDHNEQDLPIEEFESALPIGLDGSCNGLQNFSALLRDEIGGKATNLVPADKPADIYTQVADEGNAIIEQDALNGDEMAEKWHGKLTRKLTKRNTMTVPYSVTEYGMRDQLVQEFAKLSKEGGEEFKGAGMADALYLAKVNYQAIGRVVVAARAAMGWLKEVASLVTATGVPVSWRSPSGFVVSQRYTEMMAKGYDFDVAGRRFRMTLSFPGKKINRRKQRSGISPNFVHALDAAHMHRTVSRLHAEGVRAFAMIHDSYGTHAGDIDRLGRALRECFVEQYTPDVLGDFRQQLIDGLTPEVAEQLPPVPPFGTLELAGVLKSDYFFA